MMSSRWWSNTRVLHVAGATPQKWLSVCMLMACVPLTRGGVVDPSRASHVPVKKDRGAEGRAGEEEEESAVLVLREAPDRNEGRFCRGIRPVLRELRGTVGRHVRCVSPNYTEGGYFGSTVDLATSTFHNGCFGGSVAHGEAVRYHEQPIPEIGSRIKTTVRIGADSRIDLSSHGIVPAVYVLDHPRGVTGAEIEVAYLDPVVRSSTNLAHTLTTLARDEDAPPMVSRAASSCLEHLCKEGSVHTAMIVSARPWVHIALQGGTAAGLRPLEVNGAVSIDGDGRAFTVRPSRRVNLAAGFRRSRHELGEACVGDGVARDRPPGWTPPCATIVHHGVHATLEGCLRNGATVVTCHFSVVSPERDRELWVHVDGGRDEVSTLVDEKGSSRSARMGSSGNEFAERGLMVSLVANAPASVTLEFRDVDSSAIRFSRVVLRARADEELSFDFRGVPKRSELDQCRQSMP